MLRTNDAFLTFTEALYQQQASKENIVRKNFPAGSLLFRQGTSSTKVLIIASGITKCFISEENDKDFIVEFLGKGEIAGEIEAIRSIKCLCNITALTTVTAYVIPIPFFKELLAKHPPFQQLLLEELAERIINTSTRAATQQLYTVEYGLTRLLAFQEKQQLAVSKEDMAAYLGIAVRSLNRVLKGMNRPE
ncbi:Crp/Fnr family transcriptional regulator [Chitinophaga nivalis]|uniref:Crp/Fnr family transcriptional regulator n=1 Tax=Chitinophaga nivalis TaxID=2991709 RepID=A0ABT3II67_9BACT|nr:Crp/Fnr family transcriptional regulator [Chitinophaga nivalis]MCW3466660.1 Crp/Fnr family transcriptional regulator [Chitinophaga nivalis]MCW3483649.1 Crp/Fnr family transcriptional regulator [Chitinophaga nivalis]